VTNATFPSKIPTTANSPFTTEDEMHLRCGSQRILKTEVDQIARDKENETLSLRADW
jgi:hypothetical protein